MTTTSERVPSQIGELLVLAGAGGVTAIRLPDDERHASAHAPGPLTRAARAQLREYFAGQRTRFDLPLAPVGSEFQRRVWLALADIPYGTTISYAELARRVGRPGAARAIGGAVGRNPIPIVLPCHRVIGSDGSLTGYSGGVMIKRRLLELEDALPRA